MGKQKRIKSKKEAEKAIREHNMFLDCCMNLGLLAAAKVIPDATLDSFFKAQEERLKYLGYDIVEAAGCMEALKNSLMELRGEPDAPSRKTENIRAN